jgi:phospholipid/cholesterol/gamma-HCH transport system permease protein
MQVTEEMEALRTFGASPTLRIALPKVLGLSVVMPLLVTWTDFTGVLGAMYTSKHALGVPWGMWVHRFPETVSWLQFAVGRSSPWWARVAAARRPSCAASLVSSHLRPAR